MKNAKRMIFAGYSSMVYRLLDPTTKHIIISKNVEFYEEEKTYNDFINVFQNIDEDEPDDESQFQESVIDSSL